MTPRYAPSIGGVEVHAEKLATGLKARGIPVEVVTTDPSASGPYVETLDGIAVRRFPTLGGDATYHISPSLFRWLSRHGGEYRLIHGHSYHSPVTLAAAWGAARAGVPFVVTPHYHGGGHTGFRATLHVPYKPFGRRVLRSAAAVICVSECERDLIEAHFDAQLPTKVIRNGVDVDELIQAQPIEQAENMTRLLCVARLEEYKQVQLVVAALAHLTERFALTVIGDGPARKSIEAAMRQPRVAGRASLLPNVERSELVGWYQAADIYVSLSRHEAFGLTVLEAAVAGLPMVLSDIPAHRELSQLLPAGQATLVKPRATSMEVAAAVADAQDHPRSSTVDWAPPTWPAMVDSVVEVYELVAPGSAGPRTITDEHRPRRPGRRLPVAASRAPAQKRPRA